MPWGIRGRAKTFAWRRGFDFLERLGVHVTPVRFDSPIPEVRRLPQTLWSDGASLPGLTIEPDVQMAFLRSLDFSTFESELRGIDLSNPFFGGLDASILFAITRRFQPARIIEIGSGYSSQIMQRALARRPSIHHVIEPYPRAFVEELAATGAIELQRKEVQQVPLEFFDQLQAGDILFIDSSHVVSIGSDVQFEILELLPRLHPGVVVHFHDIFWPEEYPHSWVTEFHWFLNEQYMLQAFLAFNDRFETMLGVNYVRSGLPDEVKSVTGRGDAGSSFWMRRRNGDH